MEKLIGYCGIICSDCPVLIATRENDAAERKRIAEMFTEQYGAKYKPEDINCNGCTSDSSRVFSYCSICGIRKCGREKKVANCAYCSEYSCEKLAELFNKYPRAKEALDKIRSENGIKKSNV